MIMRLSKVIDSILPLGKSVEREEKASRASPLLAPLTAMHRQSQPVWSPRNYAALAREGYAKNPIVYRAVRLVAEAAASVPLLLYEGEEELVTHPLLSLLARPNAQETGPDFLEAVYGYLLTSGNAYLEQVSVDPDTVGAEPRELYALRPDRVKVVPGAYGWPEAFDYTVSSKTLRLPADADGGVAPIRHIKMFHPLNDHYGFAPVEAAQMSLDIHNAAASWNKALLDNAARPSGALVYGAGDAVNLTSDQFDRLKEELESGYQGARNAGRPLLLEGGLDWKPMGLTPKDMDFIEAKNQAAREIALAFGVPPMLLAIPGDNTYSNYQEANRAFWRGAVLPLVKRMAANLATWLGPAWGENLRLEPDIDAVEALSTEREALWRRVDAASFLSEDEKRTAVGYGARQEGVGNA